MLKPPENAFIAEKMFLAKNQQLTILSPKRVKAEKTGTTLYVHVMNATARRGR